MCVMCIRICRETGTVLKSVVDLCRGKVSDTELPTFLRINTIMINPLKTKIYLHHVKFLRHQIHSVSITKTSCLKMYWQVAGVIL
jgi:hypothetical protein